MKPFWILCLFFNFVSVYGYDYSKKQGEEWEEFRETLVLHGICPYFYENPMRQSRFDGICNEYCAEQTGSTSSGCDWLKLAQLNLPDDYDKSLIDHDYSEPFIIAKCKCNFPELEYLVGQLISLILDALRQLAELICNVIQEIMPIIKTTLKALDIATDVVPLPQAKMAKLLIKGAKTFYENGMGEDEFFDSWVDKKCGSVKHPGNVFSNLLSAPDSQGRSEGCFKKKKNNCRRIDRVPDSKKDDKDDKPPKKDDKSTTKASKTSSRTVSTMTSKTSSSSASKTSSSSQRSKSSSSSLIVSSYPTYTPLSFNSSSTSASGH